MALQFNWLERRPVTAEVFCAFESRQGRHSVQDGHCTKASTQGGGRRAHHSCARPRKSLVQKPIQKRTGRSLVIFFVSVLVANSTKCPSVRRGQSFSLPEAPGPAGEYRTHSARIQQYLMSAQNFGHNQVGSRRKREFNRAGRKVQVHRCVENLRKSE